MFRYIYISINIVVGLVRKVLFTDFDYHMTITHINGDMSYFARVGIFNSELHMFAVDDWSCRFSNM